MVGRIAICLATLIIGLSGCSKASTDQKLCKAKLLEQFINPETAQFYEFKALDDKQAGNAIEETIWRKYDRIPEADREQYRDQLQPEIDENRKLFKLSKLDAYSLRAKAASKLGLMITSNYLCIVSKNTCECSVIG